MSDETLRGYYANAPLAKTYREKKTPTRIRRKSKPKAERDHTAEIRAYVFARERGRCRCCRFREGQSMHELRPRSIGGKVSKRNSVWVCGDGVNGCHGFLQRHEIIYVTASDLRAEGSLLFYPNGKAATEWLKIRRDEHIESAPMRELEAE